MATDIRIAPSILSADFGRLAEDVGAVADAGADYIHVDVMDGHFVPNLTIGPLIIEAVRRATAVPLDVHLMVANAEQYIDEYARAGADMISVHAEACTHLHRAIQRIRSLGKRACVALNPATPIDALAHVLGDLSMVLIMTVNPGFGGQAFIEAMVPKIRAMRSLIEDRGLDVDIQVDGGVKVDNVHVPVAAGANVIVSGSGVFKAPAGYAETIAALRERAAAATPQR